MKKLLFQLDTDPRPSTFDAVVACDAGVDHLVPLAGMTPENCGPAVEGVIYTRPPAHKKDSALFVGGSRLADGEALLAAVRGHFHGGFRVSVMLDSNGANTTAAAAVALLLAEFGDGAKTGGGGADDGGGGDGNDDGGGGGNGGRPLPLAGRTAAVLAGTGPVGQRIAGLLGAEGAAVRLGSRDLGRARAAADAVAERFGVRCEPVAVADESALPAALEGAAVAVATGAPGVRLLPEAAWRDHPDLELLADPGTTPPSGIEGLDPFDRGEARHGKRTFGGLAIGSLKLRLHRACIARLFERNDQVLDAEEIYALARELAATAAA